MRKSTLVILVSLAVATAMMLSASPAGATHGDVKAERKICRTFGTPKPGSVTYAGPSNLGVYCVARRNEERYGVIGHHDRAKARRGARYICRWYDAGVVRRGKSVVVSPEPGFHRMGWVARRLDGDVICNG